MRPHHRSCATNSEEQPLDPEATCDCRAQPWPIRGAELRLEFRTSEPGGMFDHPVPERNTVSDDLSDWFGDREAFLSSFIGDAAHVLGVPDPYERLSAAREALRKLMNRREAVCKSDIEQLWRSLI